MKVQYSSSFADFLYKKRHSSKVAELLYHDNTSWSDSGDYTTIENINYITFRTNGTISYLPAGKEHKINPDTGEWLRDGRQEGKPAKVIRKLLNKTGLSRLNDADFELFANNYKAAYSAEGYEFKLLPHSKISTVYDMDRENSGTLGDSCMNSDSEYLQIYDKCKKLQILTLQKDGILFGRALVWKINKDVTLMDRIYVAKDFLYEHFLEYAKEHNMWRKKHYSTYQYKENFILPDGTERREVFKIEVDTNCDYFPYIDTFCFGGNGFLMNNNGDDCCYTYNNTDGSRDGESDDHEDETYDEIRDEYISDDDAVEITHGSSRYRGRYTHIDDTIYTEDGHRYHENDEDVHFVSINGRYYDHNSDDIINIDGDYHLLSDAVYCDRDSEYYLREDCVETEEGEWIKRDDATQVNGEWIHNDDVVEDEEETENEVENESTSINKIVDLKF